MESITPHFIVEYHSVSENAKYSVECFLVFQQPENVIELESLLSIDEVGSLQELTDLVDVSALNVVTEHFEGDFGELIHNTEVTRLRSCNHFLVHGDVGRELHELSSLREVEVEPECQCGVCPQFLCLCLLIIRVRDWQ